MSIKPGSATLYELVAEKGDRRILLSYTDRRTRGMLWRVAMKHGRKLAALAGAENLIPSKRAGEGATVGDWRIRWTGRTQRDAVHTRLELPWIGDT